MVTRKLTLESKDEAKVGKDAILALSQSLAEGFSFDDDKDEEDQSEESSSCSRSPSSSPPLRSALRKRHHKQTPNGVGKNDNSSTIINNSGPTGSVKFGERDDPESRAAWLTSETRRRSTSLQQPVRRESKSLHDDEEVSLGGHDFDGLDTDTSDSTNQEYFEKLSTDESSFRRSTIDPSQHLPVIQSDDDNGDTDGDDNDDDSVDAKNTRGISIEQTATFVPENSSKQRRRMMLMKAKQQVTPEEQQTNEPASNHKSESTLPKKDPLIAKCVIRASRRRNLVDTYTKPLLTSLMEDDPVEIRTYLNNFDETLESLHDDIGIALEMYADTVGFRYKELVVTKQQVMHVDFWRRYFYKCDEKKILKDLRRRSKLGLLGQSTRNLLNGSNHSLNSLNSDGSGYARESRRKSDPRRSRSIGTSSTTTKKSSTRPVRSKSSASAIPSSTTTTTSSSSRRKHSTASSNIYSRRSGNHEDTESPMIAAASSS